MANNQIVNDGSLKAPHKKYQIFSHFLLKIIAIVAMTIDHISFFFFSPNTTLYVVTRIIGRLAFPLFCFMGVQGVFHSHNSYKYALKMLVIGMIMDLVYYLFDQSYSGNALVSLGLGVFALTLIKRKDWYSLIAVVPISIMVLSDFNFFPIRMDTGFLGICLMLGFYFAEILGEKYLDYQGKQNGFSEDGIKLMKADLLRSKQNLIAVLMMISIYLLFMLYNNYDINQYPIPNLLPYSIESYGVLAGIIIFLYNGTQGYSNKYVNIGCYLYYPLHLVILFLIDLVI